MHPLMYGYTAEAIDGMLSAYHRVLALALGQSLREYSKSYLVFVEQLGISGIMPVAHYRASRMEHDDSEERIIQDVIEFWKRFDSVLHLEFP